ncbi:MAG: peptide-methionine (S)-S-oxide reductase MsrA [Candidatus Woesebacteria bacterium]|jgi:methionine-S-sulfoxide reductase
MPSNLHTDKALFAAGCFWGVEQAFYKTPGVVETEVGYTGGHTQNPTYEQVCSQTTGHAETVQVTYNPAKVTYQQLLDVLFDIHDPTQVDRQGPDVGSNYRSAIFYLDDQQKHAAQRYIENLNSSGKYHAPVTTEVSAATKFWPAEEYHQKYFLKHTDYACPIPGREL